MGLLTIVMSLLLQIIFFMPLAIIIIVTALPRHLTIRKVSELLLDVCNLFVLLLSVNAALTLVHVFWDVSFFFDIFLPSRDVVSGTNVWDRALNMGRYLGVFSTPFEAGIVYGLGVLCWIYARQKQMKSTIFQQICLWLIVAGGILTVSKAFIFTIPLFFFYVVFAFRAQIGNHY
jgi:hypothetical protein